MAFVSTQGPSCVTRPWGVIECDCEFDFWGNAKCNRGDISQARYGDIMQGVRSGSTSANGSATGSGNGSGTGSGSQYDNRSVSVSASASAREESRTWAFLKAIVFIYE